MHPRVQALIFLAIFLCTIVILAIGAPLYLYRQEQAERYVGNVTGIIDGTPTKLTATLGGVYGITVNLKVGTAENNQDRVGDQILVMLGPQWEILTDETELTLSGCALGEKERMLFDCVVESYEIK